MTKTITEIHSILNEHRLENPKTAYFDQLDAPIDTDIFPLIKTITNTTPFTTRNSCSGTLTDHYDDITALEDKLTIRDYGRIWDYPEKQYGRGPWISFDPHFHTTDEQTVTNTIEFHTLKRNLNALTITNQYYTTTIDVNLEYRHDMVGYNLDPSLHSLGNMHLTIDFDTANWEEHNLSLHEANTQIQGVLTLLTNFFENYNTYMDGKLGLPDSLQYNCETQTLET